MRSPFRTPLLALAMLAALTASATAQQAPTVIADLRADIEEVEKKITDLARAIPEDKYSWRPAAGVRSIGEVLMHVAADNYLIPAAIGYSADPSTGIKGDDYKTALAYEQRKVSRDAAIAEMEKSFAHLKKAMQATTPERLSQKVQMFGQSFTMQQTWILATTHLHEHLGQAIAYARSNNVVPPWSQ